VAKLESVTIVVPDAPICERINRLADEMVVTGREIARQMTPVGQSANAVASNGVSHALQAVIMQATRAGVSDEALFCAVATAVGYFARLQKLGPPRVVCDQIGARGFDAVQLALDASRTGFPTRGNA